MKYINHTQEEPILIQLIVFQRVKPKSCLELTNNQYLLVTPLAERSNHTKIGMVVKFGILSTIGEGV